MSCVAVYHPLFSSGYPPPPMRSFWGVFFGPVTSVIISKSPPFTGPQVDVNKVVRGPPGPESVQSDLPSYQGSPAGEERGTGRVVGVAEDTATGQVQRPSMPPGERPVRM